MSGTVVSAVLVAALLLVSTSATWAAPEGRIGINVALNTEVTGQILKELGKHGKVVDVLYKVKAVTMQAKAGDLAAVQGLPFVAAANADAERSGAPIDGVQAGDFVDGLSTWNLDAINVTDSGSGRMVELNGTGVHVAVLDTGLLQNWRAYFPEERIPIQYAKSFGAGGGERGNISEQPNKWERDTNSHGTHVTSTILGYSLGGTPINGVAPMIEIIPVKVLNQNGSGWSSMVGAGIQYVGDLKAGPLADYPVVINMSLGGPELEAVEKAAVDYAISQGVIIVASAGNEGEMGMGYPGAYEPVISVAASGWVGEWTTGGWWMSDVADPASPADFYVTDFASRELTGQDLDVVAPGSWVVGPYQLQMGQLSYYYLGGTSMASPHVAGIVALMAQKHPGLAASKAEGILESTATCLPPGTRTVLQPWGPETFVWGDDATGAGLVTADAALAATP